MINWWFYNSNDYDNFFKNNRRKKHNFLKIKDYERFATNSFHIWTVSPYTIPKPFIISIKFSYTLSSLKINSKNRNLEIKTKEKIARCMVEDIDKSTNLNISISKCKFSNNEGYTIEKIEIQPGYDLIGNFEDNTAIPGMNSSNNEIDKMKNASYFIFKDSINNLKSKSIEGNITKDRKNVKFVLYHQKNNTLKIIKGKGSFLKENKKINFTIEKRIDYNEGITIIPNQMCRSEDGEYLYIFNKDGDDNSLPIINNLYINSFNNTEIFIKKKSRLSTRTIIAIFIPSYLLLIIVYIIIALYKGKDFNIKVAINQETLTLILDNNK